MSQTCDLQPPPQIDGHGAQEQINYIEDTLMSVEQILQDSIRSQNESAGEVAGLRTQSGANAEKASQYETVLLGLWDIISSERSPDDADDDDDDHHRPREPFSLQAFNTRVQHMFDRATHLDEQTSILRRQIAQQRELADRPRSADLEREREMAALRAENAAVQEQLTAMLARHAAAETSMRDAQAEMLHELDRLKEVAAEQTSQREKSLALSSQLGEMQQRHADALADLEDARRAEDEALAEMEEQRACARELGERMEALEAELEDERDDARISSAEAQAKEQELANARKKLEAKQAEMAEMESEVARLATELTVAKAELDGAYGSRAERAKDAAPSPEVQARLDRAEEMEKRIGEMEGEKEAREREAAAREAEMAGLAERHRAAEDRSRTLEAQLASLREEMGALAAAGSKGGDDERVQLLERELKELADELQELTRESVELEREREQMEHLVDGLRDRCDVLEGQLSDERVRWLGIKSPSGTPTLAGEPAKEMTSTMVLRNEFKKMMRETRAEGVRLLRAEQEERRRLEGVVRSLRRENLPSRGPSRNGLSPRPYPS
ncbi:hypothetical protein H2203_001605 [Taxawa tesnikishii (nom. ined.)]|nr:hypothetical protein H2203_001605 [Dothideales sp. JES 119]